MSDTNPLATTPEINGLRFEDALSAIEEIAAQLESGQLDLAQAFAAHQRGAALLAHAQALLDAAAKTIEVIDGQGSRSLPRDDLEAL